MSSQLDFYLARAAEAWDAMAARAHRGDTMRARQEADKRALAEAAGATAAE